MRRLSLLMALAGVFALLGNWAQAQQTQFTIDEILALADKNSTSIQSYESALKTAESAVDAARAELLPDISASLSVSYLGNGYIWDRDFTNGKSVDMPHFGNNFALKVSQAIYTGGALSSGIRLAELGAEMAELEASGNKQAIHFLLVGYYLQIFQLYNQQHVFEENLSLTKQVIEQMKARHEAGTALRNDITRYELQQAQIKLQLTQAEDARKIVNHQLITVLGLPAETEILPDTTIAAHLPIPQTESDWQFAACTGSTGLQQASLAVDISRTKEKLERSELLPKIAIVAEDNLNGPVTIEVPALDNNFNYWYVGVGVSYNFSSLFKNNKKLRQARLATREAEDRLTLAQEGVENSVQAAYTNLLTSFTELETEKKNVDLANQNYDVIVNRYHNDLALITDLVDAQNTKLTAELRLVNARINVIYNYYNMLYVSGQI